MELEDASLGAKEAEVRFRSRTPPPDPADAAAMARRQADWWRPIRGLVERRGVPREPIVEVACGGRPRSAYLTSVHGVRAFALDISLHSLLNARRRMEILGTQPMPTLICADADTLPFADRSVGTLFTFEFLHHLPQPETFLREVRRVLRGTYHFDEEPFAPMLRLHLYRRRRECTSIEERKRNPLIKLLRFYVSDPKCRAMDEGIVEMMDMRLKDWKEALESLPGLKLRATAIGGFWSTRNASTTGLASGLMDLLGGNIEGEWAAPDRAEPEGAEGMNPLACPSCGGSLAGHSAMKCNRCSELFPVVEGIPILIRESLRRRLYPEFA